MRGRAGEGSGPPLRVSAAAYDRPAPPPVRRLVSRFGHRVAHWIVPASCAGCGAALSPARPPFGLCARCRGRLVLAAPRDAACPCCGGPIPEPPRRGSIRTELEPPRVPPGGTAARRRPSPGGGLSRAVPLCDACRRRPPAFERLIAPWSYRPPLSEVAKALKFGRLPHLGGRLARPLAAALRTERGVGVGPGACEVVVPVALHWRRRLARGYDQAERIARPLARELGLPCRAALVRVRRTPPQTALARDARRANVRGAFRVRRHLVGRVAGRRVLLVDDVATTGATLDAAARALLAAGARAVVAAAVARTPETRPEQARRRGAGRSESDV